MHYPQKTQDGIKRSVLFDFVHVERGTSEQIGVSFSSVGLISKSANRRLHVTVPSMNKLLPATLDNYFDFFLCNLLRLLGF